MIATLRLLKVTIASRDTGVGAASRKRSKEGDHARFLVSFQRDDGHEAFSYASPGIRQRFQTPEIFMAMVRSGYAAVYRPRAAEFLEMLVKDGRTVQMMRFVGPDGVAVIAMYDMERQPDGTWRISGVVLLCTEETVS